MKPLAKAVQDALEYLDLKQATPEIGGHLIFYDASGHSYAVHARLANVTNKHVRGRKWIIRLPDAKRCDYFLGIEYDQDDESLFLVFLLPATIALSSDIRTTYVFGIPDLNQSIQNSRDLHVLCKMKWLPGNLQELVYLDDVRRTVTENTGPMYTAGTRMPDRGEIKTFRYIRDPKITAFALSRAKGICDLCNKPGPFIDTSTNYPFLEHHHITWLGENGADNCENSAALCPNCHRAAHFSANADSIKEKLKGIVTNKLALLYQHQA
jgi:hypothetical protein